jgi:hypothetical protein
MKNETKENFGPTVAFTLQALEELKSRGFRYVRVNAFTQDKRMDYMEPRYFVLAPIKDLPDDMSKKGIYEPINSQLLTDWANSPDEGIKVFVIKT